MPSVERAEPQYVRIVRHIREEILAGRLNEGDRVPSARQIVVDWNVSLATASKVLNVLRAEDLARGIPGVGTIVTAQRSLYRSAAEGRLAIHRTSKIYPPGHHVHIRVAELTIASDRVAAALGLEIAVPVIRRQRTTYDRGGTPVSTSASWFDGDLAATCPDLLVAERIEQGTSSYIEAQTGRVAPTGYDQLAAGVASDEIATELGIAPGTPVLFARNRWADEQGRAIEYDESVSAPDRWAFYEYTISSESK